MRNIFLTAAVAACCFVAVPAGAATVVAPQDNSAPGPSLVFTGGSATATFGAEYTRDDTSFSDTFFFTLGQFATLTAGQLLTSAGGSSAPYKGDLDIKFVKLMFGPATVLTFDKSSSPKFSDKNELFSLPGASLNQLLAPGSYSLNLTGFADNVSLSTARGGAGPGTYSGSLTFAAAQVAGAVPEPATWAMFLVGFFGLGFMMRQRKSARREGHATIAHS